MSKFADLHIHTHYSDSTSSPQEVVDQALKVGLDCIAISDHDTVDGIDPTMEIAQEHGLEVISGVEFSAEDDGKDIHVLGYLFDHHNQELLDILRVMQDSRLRRMEEMIKKLHELGIKDITMEEVCEQTKKDSVGRPHLAQKLVQKKHVKSIKEAFDNYLADWAPAYVSKFKVSVQDAVAHIHKAGGLAVLAHPMVTQVDERIPRFVSEGLDGLEVFYPNTSSTIKEFYSGICQKHGLLKTGGSDAHGSAKRNTYIGKLKLPYEYVEKLKQAHESKT